MRGAGEPETHSTPGLPVEPGIEDLARAADRLFYAMRRSRSATVGQSAGGLSLAQLTLLAPWPRSPGARACPSAAWLLAPRSACPPPPACSSSWRAPV
ncbi:hypothetical protein [Streptomyces sp. Ac-502]|uniref:hypothetical protein n=1 Tax=Streptomyces sp. Ac-502 TaxID=3342801 RepID=UPI003862D110